MLVVLCAELLRRRDRERDFRVLRPDHRCALATSKIVTSAEYGPAYEQSQCCCIAVDRDRSGLDGGSVFIVMHPAVTTCSTADSLRGLRPRPGDQMYVSVTSISSRMPQQCCAVLGTDGCSSIDISLDNIRDLHVYRRIVHADVISQRVIII